MSKSVFLGTILASAPDYGVALVFKAYSTPAISDTIIARFPHSDSEYGAVPEAYYATGSSVVCRMMSGSTHLAYIIGPANELEADLREGTLSNAFYNADEFTTGDAKAPVIFLDEVLSETASWFNNYAHGAPRDVLPGDFSVTDKQGLAGLHVGRFLSQLRGSAIAFVDVSGITHRVRLVGDVIEHHTFASETVNSSELGVHNRALNTSEGFGVLTGATVKESEERNSLERINKTALPLYRMQQTEGAVVGGSEELVLAFPLKAAVHDSTTEPPILSKRRSSLSGELLSASAFGMSSIKTPYIAGVHQVGYDKKPLEGDNFDELREPFKHEPTKEEDEPKEEKKEDVVDDAALNKLLETLTSKDYIDKLQEKMAEKGLCISRLDKSLSSELQGSAVPVGPTNAQQYPLPSSIEITDPATGEKKQYYASTSFITQEPDGSILISDGYNSEIRMSRGNITISPALDLILRPGRDLSAMVPRHQAFNSRVTTTISSLGDTYVRSEKDLKIAGATSGQGAVVFESKAEGASSDSGVVIRSNGNLSVTGSDLYIGRNAHTGTAKNTVTEPDNGGAIIIDAGSKGLVSTRSRAFSVDSGEIILGALQGSSKSALVVSSNFIGAYTPNVLMPAALSLGPVEGVPTMSVLRDGKEESVALSIASLGHIFTNGDIRSDRTIYANGRMQANQGIAARSVISSHETNGVVKYPEKVFKSNPLEPRPAFQNIGQGQVQGLKALSTTLYQDYFVMSNGFSFPHYAGVDSALRMPGMRWQQPVAGAPSPYVWNEKYIKDAEGLDTACYPGYSAWEQGVISGKDYTEKPLKDNYSINTTI